MTLNKWIAVNAILITLAAQTGVLAQETQTIDTQRTVTTDRVVTRDEVVTTERTSDYDKPFPANQLSLQAFGTYASRNRTGHTHKGLGAGVGLTYFFTRHVGIGADTYVEELKVPYRVNGSLIVRLPLPDRFSHLAVYGLAGGGRQFKDVPQYTWHAGGGLEYRVRRGFGIFTDARQVFPDKTGDYFLARAGVNFGF